LGLGWGCSRTCNVKVYWR